MCERSAESSGGARDQRGFHGNGGSCCGYEDKTRVLWMHTSVSTDLTSMLSTTSTRQWLSMTGTEMSAIPIVVQ